MTLPNNTLTLWVFTFHKSPSPLVSISGSYSTCQWVTALETALGTALGLVLSPPGYPSLHVYVIPEISINTKIHKLNLSLAWVGGRYWRTDPHVMPPRLLRPLPASHFPPSRAKVSLACQGHWKVITWLTLSARRLTKALRRLYPLCRSDLGGGAHFRLNYLNC